MSYRPANHENDAIYAANVVDHREWKRADGIARLGASDATEPGTFLPTGPGDAFESEWRRWLAESFESWLGPAFVEVYLATSRMQSERVAELDREIGGRLSPEAHERSRAAALPWLEGRTEVQRQPQWVKYLRAQAAGEVPGHVTTIFALQAALFHLPLLSSLAAYVIFEGMNGWAAVHGGKGRDAEAFASRHPEAMEAARRVFRSLADTESGAPWLTSL